jgi:glutamate racemase
MSTRAPVGVFDSGVGGLSVLREIRRELPAEDLIYVADSAHAPYGDRDAAFIIRRAVALLEFLAGRGAKAVVVASNTVTGVAVDVLRARSRLPIVAIEPAIKPAAAITRSGVVGVLATTQTLSSPRFARLVDTHASGIQVVVQACPGLVEQVEAGELETQATEALVGAYVAPLVARGADTIVLGCTHYPFLSDAIGRAAGNGVTLIDPAVAVARELRRRLQALDLLAPGAAQGTTAFLTTGDAERMRRVIGRLGLPVGNVARLQEDESKPST